MALLLAKREASLLILLLQDEGLRFLFSKAQIIDELEATLPRWLHRKSWQVNVLNHFLFLISLNADGLRSSTCTLNFVSRALLHLLLASFGLGIGKQSGRSCY